MATALEICNIALQKIGDTTITSLSGTDARSLRVNRVYELCRDLVLHEDNWQFAIKRAQLKLLSADINAMTYFAGADLYVAVGDQGLIYTSSDNGAMWERQTSNTGYDLHGACVATIGTTSTIIVVGKRGTILTSSDGIAWISRTSGTNKNLYAVAGYTDNVVAVGASGCILSSTDVVTWTTATSGEPQSFRGVTAYSTTPLWIAVGDGGVIRTSADMSTWTSRSSGVTTALNAVCFSGLANRYCTVGAAGVILTSMDGTTWSARTSGVSTALYAVAYEDSVFRTVGADGVVIGSPTGSTWTAITTDATDGLKAITYSDSDDSWVMAGDDGELHTSTDGSTWTAVSITPTWGWDYEYSLPGDCLRVLGVTDDDSDELAVNTFEYKLEGGKLLTDEDEIYIRYLARITDTARYPWWFVDVLALRLALEIAEIQVKSAGLSQDLQQQYLRALTRARQYNYSDVYVEDDTGVDLWTDEGR